MPNHFYRLVLNVQEELNTDDDPCVETADYNFQVGKPYKAYLKVLHSESLYFQACVKEHLAQKVGCR